MSETTGAETTTEVSRIHFLIHPGYCTYPRLSNLSIEEVQDRERRYGYITEGYIREAQTLQSDELMFIFTHAAERDFETDLVAGRVYAKTIAALRDVLGSRGIVIHDEEFRIFEKEMFDLGTSPPIVTAMHTARSRGYHFSPDVPSVAYGETMQACVVDGAESLNAAFRLTQETIILTRLTDLMRETEEEMRAIVLRMRKLEDYDCVIFDCEQTA